jgi:hypothetical protein
MVEYSLKGEGMSEDLTKKLPTSDSDKLTSILTTVQALEGHIQHLEQRVEERLYDTRPIWEKVVADISQMHESQQRLEEGQRLLQADVREIRTSQRGGLRRMSLLHETLFAMQADYRDIYDRVRGLEINRDSQNSST